MKLLVFGRTGQVAQELARQIPAGTSATFLGRDQADLREPEACAKAIETAEVDAVINAAAWTAVDAAEADEATALLVNATAPGALARACAAKSVPFLHISTDYVFDGASEIPFTPDHPTAPLGAYGRSKLAGEEAVRAAGGVHLILRTSWVFSAHGNNFVKTMLRLGADRPSLRVVADQVGGPTPAAEIARALLTVAKALRGGAIGGTHHFSGAPDASWADFAREIMARADLPCQIEDIPSSEYPTPARRPASSRLDCRAFTAAYGIQRPDWRLALDQVISELKA